MTEVVLSTCGCKPNTPLLGEFHFCEYHAEREIARLTVERDELKAELRVMREATSTALRQIRFINSHNQTGFLHDGQYLVQALSLPHAKAEAERAQKLEVVVKAARRFAFHEPLRSALAALDEEVKA